MSRLNLGEQVRTKFAIKYAKQSAQTTDFIKRMDVQKDLTVDALETSDKIPIVQIQNENYLPMSFRIDYQPNELENVKIGLQTVAPGTWSIGMTESIKEERSDIKSYERRQREDKARRTNEISAAAAKKKNDSIWHFSNTLIMWINPSSFSGSYSKEKSNTRVRGKNEDQYIRHYWGEDQPSLNLEGKTPAFYTQKTGITRQNRGDSASWAHLMSILALYQNNGCRIEEDDIRIKSVGDVILAYDGRYYSGSFRSFNISEVVEAPFIASYSMQFIVRREWRD